MDDGSSSSTVELFMAAMERMVIVLIYPWAGLSSNVVPALSEAHSGPKKLIHGAGRGDFGAGNLGIISVVLAMVNRLFQRYHRDAKQEEGKESVKSCEI